MTEEQMLERYKGLESRLVDLEVLFKSVPVIHPVENIRCKDDEYERIRVEGEYLWNLFLVASVVFTVLGSYIYLSVLIWG